MDHRQHAVQRGDLAGAGEGALQADVGQLAEAERPVDGDRIANPKPPPQPLGIVVGQLVNDRERPHLEPEQSGVARLGAGKQHGEREGARRGRGDRDRRRDAQAAANQGHGDRAREREAGRGPDRRAEGRARAGGRRLSKARRV